MTIIVMTMMMTMTMTTRRTALLLGFDDVSSSSLLYCYLLLTGGRGSPSLTLHKEEHKQHERNGGPPSLTCFLPVASLFF